MRKRALKKDLQKRLAVQEDLMKSQWQYLKKRNITFHENLTNLSKNIESLTKLCHALNERCAYLETIMRHALYSGNLFGAKLSRRLFARQAAANTPEDLAALMENIKKAWRPLQEEGEKCYRELPDGSLSTAANDGALIFADFVKKRLRGRVLDIGCGPLPRPVYLAGYPANLLTGIDPSADSGHEFAYYQGYAEDLPFADASFDTVIMATSLDHTLLPMQALREVRRVLRPDGHALIWEGTHFTFHGSFENYNPQAGNLQSVDDYHLFRLSDFSLFLFLNIFFKINDYILLDGSTMIDCSPQNNAENLPDF